MKLFFKNNKIILISILVLFISVVTVLTKYKIDYNNSLKDYDRIIQYLNDNPGINEITPKKPMMYDTYTLFSYIIVDSPLSVVMFVMPFLVMLSGIYNFYSKLKTGFVYDLKYNANPKFKAGRGYKVQDVVDNVLIKFRKNPSGRIECWYPTDEQTPFFLGLKKAFEEGYQP